MRLHLSRYIFVCALAVFIVPVTWASSRAEREHGAEIFSSTGCVHCHTIGKTGGDKGPNLSGIGRSAKPVAIRKQIVEGGKGMPAFGEVLDTKDLDDLIAYLRSCRVKTRK
jgi:Cytochrome c, mono- and diheme variants